MAEAPITEVLYIDSGKIHIEVFENCTAEDLQRAINFLLATQSKKQG